MTKKKKKKTPEFRDNNISRITARGKKKKGYQETKKKWPTDCVSLDFFQLLRQAIEKKSRDTQSVGQKNKNPPQNAAMLQLQTVLNTR